MAVELCQYLTVADAARTLGVSRSTIYNWTREKRLPCTRVGHAWLFDPEVLADWVEQHSIWPEEVEGNEA